MKKRVVLSAVAGMVLTLSAVSAAPIALPELVYYQFNEGTGTTTLNSASSPVGTPSATINGMTWSATGFGSSSALGGVSGASSTNFVDTGWQTNLGAGDWTIALWLGPLAESGSTLHYYFGDTSANSFRMFNNGIAGADNVVLRGGGVTDTYINGLSRVTANHLAWVYSSTSHTIQSYLNGVLNSTVSQGAVNVVGTAGNTLKVGGYSTNNGLETGNYMDQFMIFSRALDASGVVSAMNADFPSSGVPEPSSLALAGSGLLAALWLVRRRQS